MLLGPRVEQRHPRWHSLLASRPCHVYTLRHIPPDLTCSRSRYCFLDQEIYFYSPSTPSRASAAAGSPCPAWVARARSVGPTLSTAMSHHPSTPPARMPSAGVRRQGRTVPVQGRRVALHPLQLQPSAAVIGHATSHLPGSFRIFRCRFLHSPPVVLRYCTVPTFRPAACLGVVGRLIQPSSQPRILETPLRHPCVAWPFSSSALFSRYETGCHLQDSPLPLVNGKNLAPPPPCLPFWRNLRRATEDE